MGKQENLIGKKFGKLEVIEFDGYSNTGKKKWICKCEYGRYARHTPTKDVCSSTESPDSVQEKG